MATSEQSSFSKLKIHSEAWEDLIKNSNENRDLLTTVKLKYDFYVDALLDDYLRNNGHCCVINKVEMQQQQEDQNSKQQKQHQQQQQQQQKLQQQQQKLEDQQLQQLQQQGIENLKLEISRKIEENEKLRNFLKTCAEESSFEEIEEHENHRKMMNVCNEITVESLQTKIEVKSNELGSMKIYQKSSLVPACVCKRLEDYIKEMEVDIHKLCKQNEFLEMNVEELGEELEHVLVKTGIKQRDAAKLWRKVNPSRIIDIGLR